MVIKHKKLKWRIARALCMGAFLTLLSTVLLICFQPTNRWTGYTANTKYHDQGPSYLGDLAPRYTSSNRYKVATRSGNEMLFGLNTGIDQIQYTFGDPNMEWDLAEDELPPRVFINRTRYGFPWRVLYRDHISTQTSTKNPQVSQFHQRAYARVGSRRGLDRPAWFPTWVITYRVPITPLWGGILANMLSWSLLWFVLALIPARVVNRHRRRNGLCLACGYAVEDLEICPECGMDHAACSPG